MDKNEKEAGQVFSDISKMLSKSIHDINNPLCVILGQLSILELLLKKENIDLERIQKSIDKMKSGSDKMQERMNNLRDYCKVAMGDTNYNTWQAITSSVTYLFSPIEGFLINFSLPEQEFKLPIQPTFMLLYHLIHKNMGKEVVEITIEQNDSYAIFTSQGSYCELAQLPQINFESIINEMGGKLELDTERISITIPLQP